MLRDKVAFRPKPLTPSQHQRHAFRRIEKAVRRLGREVVLFKVWRASYDETSRAHSVQLFPAKAGAISVNVPASLSPPAIYKLLRVSITFAESSVRGRT